MALGFGRKKAGSDDSAPLAPQSNAPADDTGGLGLDAFADQLENGGGALNSQATSAFDFPEGETSDFTPNSATSAPEALDFNSMFAAEQRSAIESGLIPAPVTPPPTPVDDDADTLANATPSADSSTSEIGVRKKMPVLPIVGGLVLLVLIGGAAAYFKGGDKTVEDTTVPTPRPVAPQANAPAAPPAPEAPPVSAATSAPVKPSAPVAASSSPSMSTQLKALWNQGAEAKHRHDYISARRIWQQGLQLQPGNKGFIESIAKLPK